jgi:protein gp37
MGKTNIEWTEHVWNPVRGCSRVSAGCVNCYAEAVAARFSDPGMAYEGLARRTPSGPRWTGEIRLIEKHLADPLKWKAPRRIFVNSMSDLFHEKLELEILDRIFAVMALCREHTFQILTKRPQRMFEYVSKLQERCVPISLAIVRNPWYDSPHFSPCAVATIEDRIAEGSLSNVWLGVSCEDQKTADERIPLLLNAPAAVRWISAEPLLGPIALHETDQPEVNVDWLRGFDGCEPTIPRLDWVVIGGESGPHARPMCLSWARSLVEQCKAASVPVFVKQMGRKIRHDAGEQWPRVTGSFQECSTFFKHLVDSKGGDPSEWPEDLRIREYPAPAAVPA